MSDNDIKTICEKIGSLQEKILKSKFAETVTESEMLCLILAVRGLNDQKAEIAVLTTAVDNSTKEFLKLHDEYQDQKADIDKLQEVNADLNESLRLAAEANKDLKAEVEEWKARANDWQNQYLKLIEEMEIYQEHIDQDIIYAKAIKAEAIKEFAVRLKEKSGCIVARRDGVELYTTKLYQIRATDIDSLVKEMTEGEKI